MKHTLHDNILGEIDYEGVPHQWRFVWADTSYKDFFNVVKFQAMKTGCYVLFYESGDTVTVAPGWRYCYQCSPEGCGSDEYGT